MATARVPFTKPPLDIPDQLALLRRRGLEIPDSERAAKYLRFIGYYRLAVYCRPFQVPDDPSHTFRERVDFDQVVALYIFDRKLRLLVLDAIERIEVAARSVINNHMTIAYGSDWYTTPAYFINRSSHFRHDTFLDTVERETKFARKGKGGPEYCKAYYEKYTEPKLPPSWMIAELLPFGTWSMLYAALKSPPDKKHICNTFSVPYGLFESWLHALSHVRNVCAHHALLWTAHFTIKPKIKKIYPMVTNDSRFYAQAVVMQHILRVIAKSSTWKGRLKTHLETCPLPYHAPMGFPETWYQLRPWVE